MPLNIPVQLPAVDILRKENIFVMDSERASNQEIRPLKIVILNLMPLKIVTETDLIRLLSNSPLQIEVDFMHLESHNPKNTPAEHMAAFYKTFSQIRKQNYDGMIVTGAPVEQMQFEEVAYWPEIVRIFDWARNHVTSTLFICWAAQAGLYHYYSIPKYPLKEKLFGVFKHTVNEPLNPIFRGFDDEFYVPHSRYSELRAEDIARNPALRILSQSEEAGVYIVAAREGREFFITGHSEYSANTLHEEYLRDKAKNLPIAIPRNYYRNDRPEEQPLVRWKSHANMLFTNWLNYFVYQETPYDLKNIH